ncbi:MAG: Integral rane sensor signal transduction histidine kinase [Rhodospirillales bacterium]|nr:Integral rane sensor signal transduction histidine kinase [Rhodospirillales bacterium]
MIPRFFRTWSFRLTLLYAGLFTLSVLILFGVIYWSALAYAAQDEADENDVEFHAIVDEAELAGYAQLPRIIENHIRQRARAPAAYLLEDAELHKIAGNIDPMPPRDGTFRIKPTLNGKKHRASAHFYEMPNGDHLLIGQDSASLKEMKELIARAFGVGVVATLILGLIGGGIVTTSVLRRVESVARTSRAIIAGNLSQRVPLRGSDDEFDHLAASVNAMLDRIEDLMRSMRQVSNDIAHDLRTPLTRLRQRLELARRHKQSVPELQEALDDSTLQIDSILETFGALLRIAQIEAGQGVTVNAPVDMSNLLTNIAEDFAPAAEDRDQTITTGLEPDLEVAGDRALLTQMVVNLLENALRHAPPGAQISLTAANGSNGVSVAVTDNGPGIPAAERENVLRPFYRLETSRTTEGNGLGFGLVAAIVKQHGGTLTLEDNAPGLRVTVLLPSRAAA